MRVLHVFFALVVSVTLVYAQSQLPKFVAKPDKVYKGIKYDVPRDYKMPLKKMKEGPKRVALVSFFTFDPGFTQTYAYSNVSGYKKRSSGEGASDLAVAFYENGINDLVKTFADYGMELLTPDQFLTSEEMTAAYQAFEVRKAKHNVANWLQDKSAEGHNTAWGYPDGYIVTDIVVEPYVNYTAHGGVMSKFKAMKYTPKAADKQIFMAFNDVQVPTSLGEELSKMLNVDAVLVIYSTIYCPSEKEIFLQNVNMQMYGPNPKNLEPGNETKESGRFYSRGLYYPGTRCTIRLPILSINKKEPETANIDATGYAIILTQLAKKMGDQIKKDLNKK
jgi:hypothetical protein